jgi:hypothetical protein
MRKRIVRWIITLFTSFLLLFGNTLAFASGIPQYSYNFDSGTLTLTVPSAWYGQYLWTTGTTQQVSAPNQFGGSGSVTLIGVQPGVSIPAIEVDASNDNSTWTQIQVFSTSGYSLPATFNFDLGSGLYNYLRVRIEDTNTSGGWVRYSLSCQVYGVVADQQTAQTAANAAQGAQTAAQNAQSAAQAAQTAAQNALNNTNTIINSYLSTNAGVVQDSSGTVLTAARAAQANAQNAYNAANQADADIKNAQSALSNQLNNMQNTINNIQTLLPPTLKKISGYNGATATSSTTFKVTLDYTNATDYRVAVDGNWSGWSSLSAYQILGYIPVTLPSPGMHQITVQIRNGSGSTAPTDQSSMSVFKL